MAGTVDKPLQLRMPFPDSCQSLCFRDKDHGSSMFERLFAMYKDSKYSDVGLKISHEHTIQAHRVVLASFSPYFEALLGGKWKEGSKNEIELLGLNETAVDNLIEFAYSGTIEINKDNVETVLEAANYLGVEFVKKSCGDFLKVAVDDKTCLGLWQLADVFALEELSKVAKRYVLRHFADISQQEAFLLLPFNLLTDLLADDGLCIVIEDLVPCEVEREKIVLQAVLRYIEHDLNSRKELLPQVLSLVKLPTLSEQYLKEVTEIELVADSCVCKEMLDKAQKLKMEWEDLKAEANWPYKQIDPPDKWVLPRDFAKYVVIWGRSYANGGHIPDHKHYADEYSFEDLENNCFVNGMELWFRRWNGDLVLGGLKFSYKLYDEDTAMTFGYTSDEAEEHHKFHLEENERIVRVEVSSGLMINQLTFYTNKEDDEGYPKVYGPYGEDIGLFTVEYPTGNFGYLAGVVGAVANRSRGKPGVIFRLQFAWRSYIFPGTPMPEKHYCRISENAREDDYDSDADLDGFDDYDALTIFDFYDGFQD